MISETVVSNLSSADRYDIINDRVWNEEINRNSKGCLCIVYELFMERNLSYYRQELKYRNKLY